MDQFELIDGYFNKEIPAEAIQEFEQKILTDSDFADAVAFYLSALDVVKEDNDGERKQRFRILYQEGKTIPVAPTRKLRWWPYVAAAAAITGILVSVFLFNNKNLPQQLADRYIQDNLQTLTITMGAGEDAMQTALNLYNQGKFPEALQQFETVLQKDSSNYLALQNAGISCLRIKQYDKAISYFTQLRSNTSLHANPGTFYLAITLMERNATGDRQQAHALLQQIVDNNGEGSQTALQWLKKL